MLYTVAIGMQQNLSSSYSDPKGQFYSEQTLLRLMKYLSTEQIRHERLEDAQSTLRSRIELLEMRARPAETDEKDGGKYANADKAADRDDLLAALHSMATVSYRIRDFPTAIAMFTKVLAMMPSPLEAGGSDKGSELEVEQVQQLKERATIEMTIAGRCSGDLLFL